MPTFVSSFADGGGVAPSVEREKEAGSQGEGGRGER